MSLMETDKQGQRIVLLLVVLGAVFILGGALMGVGII
ncbi:hypothetical protein J2T56_001433 [Natronobacillus azotifigens]